MRKGRANLYDTLVIFMTKVHEDEIFDRANAVAFSFTLAIFPSIIFLFSLVPFVHTYIPEIGTNQIMSFLSTTLPEEMYTVVAGTIEDIVSTRRGGLLSFGVLFALFLATNGVNTLIKAFNSCYRTKDTRGAFSTRFIALGLTIMLAFVLIIAMALLVIGQVVIDWLFSFGILTEDIIYYTIIFVRFLVILVTFFMVVSFIYYLAPAIHQRWRFLSAGTFLAALACVGVSFAFAIYINNFGTYNKIYGSIGALIALMLWLYMLSAILLLGFEWNASLDLAEEKNQSTANGENK